MGLKFSNFGKALIGSAPTGISGLNFTVEAGKGVNFPALDAGDYFYGIFKDASGNREIVKIEARSGDAMTIAVGGRGLDGTAARTWAAGDYFVAGLTNVALQESLSNANLIALGALSSAADKLAYFTGSGTASLADLSAFARTLLDDADGAAMLTTLGFSAYIQTLLDDADAATARATLGAVGLTGNETIEGSKTFSNRIVPHPTTGIAGTTGANNAMEGSVGELLQKTVSSASPVSLTNSISKTVATLDLTAGDWDIYGYMGFAFSGGASITGLLGTVSTAADSLQEPNTTHRCAAFAPVSNIIYPLPTRRLAIGSTTTIYLVLNAIFSGGTVGGYGEILARRRR